jgi:hypothetical protein
LKRWAGIPLTERTVLFSKQFPDKIISAVAIWRLYRKHGVKLKLVRLNKTTPPPRLHNFEVQRLKVLELLAQAKRENRRMVYLDEVLFTKRTFLTRSYTGRNVHTQVDQNEVMQPYKAVIASVSAEEGMEFF